MIKKKFIFHFCSFGNCSIAFAVDIFYLMGNRRPSKVKRWAIGFMDCLWWSGVILKKVNFLPKGVHLLQKFN